MFSRIKHKYKYYIQNIDYIFRHGIILYFIMCYINKFIIITHVSIQNVINSGCVCNTLMLLL